MDTFARRLVAERGWLARTARAQLLNAAWAEDAVSETVLAALERRPDFDDPQRLRAWLFGVLRHKMVDQLRHHRDSRTEGPDAPDSLAEALHADAEAEPLQQALRAQFVVDLAQVLERLPPVQSRAFVLREAWGQGTAEICAELGITPNHLGVMLFRARATLQRQLRAHWS